VASLVGSARSLAAPVEPNTFQSPNPEVGGEFAFSAAFAGNFAVFGAPGESNGAGNVHLFDVVTGALAVTIPHPEPLMGGGYGRSVAGNALVTIVGAPGAESAYVYSIVEEKLLLTFRSPNATGKGGFGEAVGATAINFIIGAPGEGNAEGAAYYFDCVTEVVLASFVSPNAQANGRFGAAVATIDFDVYIGAPEEFAGEGRVYCFNGLTGELLRTFKSPSGIAGGQFGGSIAVVRNATGTTMLLVGAPNETDPVNGDGSDGRAHLFNAATGEVIVSLDTGSPFQAGLFGARVATNGSVLVIAAPNEGTVEQRQEAGFVYLFDTSGGLIDVLVSPNAQDFGHFGLGLVVSSEDLLAGAPGEDGGNAGAGRGYVNPPAVQPQ